MTVIAYRDGVMAGDTMVSLDGVRHFSRKVWKRKGYLVGVCGDDTPPDHEYLDWFFDKSDAPKRAPLSPFKFSLLVVTPNGEIQRWTERGHFEPITSPYYAVGSGADIALGAMYAGGTAKDAALAAIRWSPGCGGRVTTRTLA